MTTPSMNTRKSGGSKTGGTASTIRKIFGSSSQRKVSQSKLNFLRKESSPSFYYRPYL